MTGGHRGGHRAGALLLLGLLAPAGCALFAPPPKPAPVHHPAPVAHHAHPPAHTAPSGSAAAAGALPHPPPATAPAPAPGAAIESEPVPAPAPEPAPVDVVGQSQSEVRALLGPPAARVAQGANETWTYRGPGCSAEIAFYYDVSRSAFFALSQRLTGGGGAQHCLGQIHAAHPS